MMIDIFLYFLLTLAILSMLSIPNSSESSSKSKSKSKSKYQYNSTNYDDYYEPQNHHCPHNLANCDDNLECSDDN